LNPVVVMYLEKLGEFVKRISGKFDSTILIVIAGLSFLIATIVNVLISSFFTPQSMLPISRSIALGKNSRSLNISDQEANQIIKRNIFNLEGGENPDDGKTSDARSKTLVPKSDLGLTVVGTIFGGDPKSGVAMIENSKKEIDTFMVGDAIFPGENAVLSHVWRERIYVLRDGNRYEYLDVTRDELRRSDRRIRTSSGTDSSNSAASRGSDIFSEPGFERKSSSIKMSSEYRRKTLTSDFAKVLQDAKAEPNMVDGKLKGFRLTRIREESIYEKSGFVDGDIISEINGIELISAPQAISTLQSLRDANQIEVTLLRGDKKSTVTINVSN